MTLHHRLTTHTLRQRTLTQSGGEVFKTTRKLALINAEDFQAARSEEAFQQSEEVSRPKEEAFQAS